MNVAKHLDGKKPDSQLPQGARTAVRADLCAPSFSALDRIGSSLRHCFCAESNDANTGDFDDLLKKLR